MEPRNIYTVIGEKRTRVKSPKGKQPAQQQFKEDCDVNTIMARFQKTGIIDHVSKYQGEYGVTSPVDFHTAMNLVAQAQSMFNELPSSIRNEFSNNPEAFLEFVQNPDNYARAKELGIALSPEATAIAEAREQQDVATPVEPTPEAPAPADGSAGDVASGGTTNP